jgi:hypothetical protein
MDRIALRFASMLILALALAKGGFPAGRPFVAGPLRLASNASLSYINPILIISNSHSGAFDLSFEYDHGGYF